MNDQLRNIRVGSISSHIVEVNVEKGYNYLMSGLAKLVEKWRL